MFIKVRKKYQNINTAKFVYFGICNFQKKTMRKKIVVAAYILCCEKLLSSPVRVIGSHVYRLIVS